MGPRRRLGAAVRTRGQAHLAGSAPGDSIRAGGGYDAFTPFEEHDLAQNPSFVKRQKELARQDKRREKEARRQQRKLEKGQEGQESGPPVEGDLEEGEAPA